MDVCYKPKSGMNWADDDDEDTFDIDSFRLLTIGATPTLEELGPLQISSCREDQSSQSPCNSIDSSNVDYDAVELADPPEPATTGAPTTMHNRKLLGDASLYLTTSPVNWPCQPPLASTFAHNANYDCKAPEAYPGLSSEFGLRYKYAAN